MKTSYRLLLLFSFAFSIALENTKVSGLKINTVATATPKLEKNVAPDTDVDVIISSDVLFLR